MMKFYYVNNKKQSNGDHEVHDQDCVYLSLDRKYLGIFTNCKDAIAEAQKTYPQSNGCYWCSKSCHTS